jgi:hypothetical protein
MSYYIVQADGVTPVVTVPDRQVVAVAGGALRLLGKNFGSYGEIVANNLVALGSNFASPTRPGSVAQSSAPLQGQLWFNTQNKTMYVNTDGTVGTTGRPGGWQPLGTAIGNIFGSTTGFDITSILDTQSVSHQAIKITVNSTVIAIISADTTSYAPNSSTGLASAFPSIGPGININSTQTNNINNYILRGVAMEAEFADMAEIYTSDIELQPGNLVKLGGAKEITMTTQAFDNDVFGVISTQPGFLLNSKDKIKNLAYPVALKGRVPCLVTGPVRKGQRIVTSDILGVGMATDSYDPTAIIGRAITDKITDTVGTIEVAVGVK